VRSFRGREGFQGIKEKEEKSTWNCERNIQWAWRGWKDITIMNMFRVMVFV